MSQSFIIIHVSFPKNFDSLNLCKQLIESKLAICIHKSNEITSFYEWDNHFESSCEYVLQIKTKKTHFSDIERLISADHPYDVPEFFSIRIDDLSQSYRHWAESLI